MTETSNRVPGRNEPDPDNVRFRSFQGGADGAGEPPNVTTAVSHLPYNKSAGLSGLPAADAGAQPPQWDKTDAPPGP